jgi:hypothetical protein
MTNGNRPQLGGFSCSGGRCREAGRRYPRLTKAKGGGDQLEADGVWLAWRLLREMAAEGKA